MKLRVRGHCKGLASFRVKTKSIFIHSVVRVTFLVEQSCCSILFPWASLGLSNRRNMSFIHSAFPY